MSTRQKSLYFFPSFHYRLMKFWTMYLNLLLQRPVLTKAATSAFLNFLQEFVSQALSSATTDTKRILSTCIKMGAYGLLASGPLSHYLYTLLNSLFSQSTLKDLIGQMLGANLVIAPIQNLVYLIAMAIIGRRSIKSSLAKGYWPLMKATWCLFPVVQLIAVRLIPQPLWIPYFNCVSFLFGVYTNLKLKSQENETKRKKK
ncbi:hypothetical protein HMI54_001050 [Coelomomyces lativittatus]|nr:hypothetical protein HMI54_001050 [Coelomomyces lativittatus]KAJ1512935.1 hypothetical protein HMI55_006044 [Coelomomyces lativittatus]KAJ1513397.1 hypothetical protein HMI56_002525 [Coelomomyces lativittatus]